MKFLFTNPIHTHTHTHTHTQAGAPDWTLLYWHWEKSKVMATTKSNGTTNYIMRQVSFNPQDNTQICVVGEKTYKLFRYSEGNLKQFAFMKGDPLNYLCQVGAPPLYGHSPASISRGKQLMWPKYNLNCSDILPNKLCMQILF